MANSIYAHTKEAVRVKVKKCELNCAPEWRKFSVDPQITSLEVLYSLLAKAFDIKSDFAIKYKAYDPAGNEMYLAVLSDWDLDAAFLRIHNLSMQTATEPCLFLQIDIKPFTEVKEWDAETPPSVAGDIYGKLPMAAASAVASTNNTREIITPLQQSLGASQKYVQNMQTKLPGLIMNQMEKTFSIVQKAFNLSEETMASLPPRAPLSDTEFRLFLDSLGQIQRCDELRKVIFLGGIDASLRRVVWKHILNVYPDVMTGKQRMDYMRQKSEHYHKLRDTWKAAVKKGCVAGELSYVTSMVKKDVLRTDRLHPFYAGSDDNQNIASLFNILTTYALNHPTVSYCQGMSDIASPLLVTMNDEAQAYICFCAIMARLRVNFMLDGIAMTQKFAHLTEALSFYDPEFWDYLKSQQADDLLFCYRWLLLELKREFPFEDALRMLEVQWSSLKYERSINKDLALYEKEFTPLLESSAPTTSSSLSGSFGSALPINSSFLQAKTRENAYTKVCALRRQSSSASLSSLSSSLGTSCNALSTTRLDSTKRLNQSLDDNLTRYGARRNRHASAKAHQSLDESKMLSLMEGMEAISKVDDDQLSKTTETSNSTCATDGDDDDVFMYPKHDEDEEENKAEAFNFHPTNPFIEDAQLDATAITEKIASHSNVTADATFRDKCSANSNAFLSSSSISDDDGVVGGGSVGVVLPTTKSDAAKNVKSASAFVPKSIMKLHNKNIISNYNAVSNIIVKQIANAAAAGGGDGENGAFVGGAKKFANSGGGHFRDLKEKIALANKRSMTFDDLNNSTEKSQQKLVKNFNEFLNFAALNKSRIADKLSTNTPSTTATITTKTTTNSFNDKSKTPSPTTLAQRQITATATTPSAILTNTATPHPLVQLTKNTGCHSSFDDSDSSSIPEATWSCSTAATAIQQTNNLSNYSLQLELNSHCSPSSSSGNILSKTPLDETPELGDSNEKQSFKNLPNDPSLTPDDSQDQDYYPMTTAITRELRLEAENLDRQVFGEPEAMVAAAAAASLAVTKNQTDIEYEKLDKDSLDLVDELKENEIITCPDVSELIVRRRERENKQIIQSNHSTAGLEANSNWRTLEHSNTQQSFSEDILNTNTTINTTVTTPTTVSAAATTAFMTSSLEALTLNPFIDESILITTQAAIPFSTTPTLLHTSNSLPEVIVPIALETNSSNLPTSYCPVTSAEPPIEVATNAADEIAFAKPATSPLKVAYATDSSGLTPPTLPPPSEFGGGNPFLMFLCLTLLLQHRNTIMKSGMDYNEIAMHFDKMVRKHDVTRVLNQARRMYIDYLKTQASYKQRLQAYEAQRDVNRNTANASGTVANAATMPCFNARATT